MTTKQRLHELIDQLDDATADRLLGTVLTLVPTQPDRDTEDEPDALEAFIGSGNSGRGDLARRHREIRAEATRGLSARDL
jgi:hypothetical protein